MWLQYCDVPQNEVGDYKCLTRLLVFHSGSLNKKRVHSLKLQTPEGNRIHCKQGTRRKSKQ